MTVNALKSGLLLVALFFWGSALAQEAQQLQTGGLAIETKTGNRYIFEVELALTPEQQQRGLMFRESLPPNGGMLFVLPQAREASFWMKNTPLSLDIIFIREDGTIANIAERTEPFSEKSIPSDGVVRGVLEVKGGTTAQLSITAGDRVVFPLQ